MEPRRQRPGLVRRFAGALLLRPTTYAEVARDPFGLPHAALVVLAGATLEAGASAALHGESALAGERLAIALVAGMIGWGAWSMLLYGAGARAFGHAAEVGAVARAVGLAHAPGVLMAGALLPGGALLAGTLYLASVLWFVAALFAATRGLFAVSPSRAGAILGATLLAHEVLRQAVRLAGLA